MKANFADERRIFAILPKWADSKEWMKKIISSDQVVNAGLVVVTLLLLSILFYALTRAINDYTITGP